MSKILNLDGSKFEENKKNGKNGNIEKVEDINEDEGEVLGFVLSNGDQIITVVEEMESESGEEDLYFKNPFFVGLVQQSGGRVGVGMKPFVAYSNQDLFGPINGVAFICQFEVPENMVKEYRNHVVRVRAQRAGLTIGNMTIGTPPTLEN